MSPGGRAGAGSTGLSPWPQPEDREKGKGDVSKIDEMAEAFIVNSLETFNQHEELGDGGTLASWSTLQEIIDNVNDHNELMIEAIRVVSDDVADLIYELMQADNDNDAQLTWMHLVNTVFNRVSARLGG